MGIKEDYGDYKSWGKPDKASTSFITVPAPRDMEFGSLNERKKWEKGRVKKVKELYEKEGWTLHEIAGLPGLGLTYYEARYIVQKNKFEPLREKKVKEVRKAIPKPFDKLLTDEQILLWEDVSKQTIDETITHATLIALEQSTLNPTLYVNLLGRIAQLQKVKAELNDLTKERQSVTIHVGLRDEPTIHDEEP